MAKEKQAPQASLDEGRQQAIRAGLYVLLLLAVLEHWMMILPLRAEALWAVRPLEAPVRPVQAPP